MSMANAMAISDGVPERGPRPTGARLETVPALQ